MSLSLEGKFGGNVHIQPVLGFWDLCIWPSTVDILFTIAVKSPSIPQVVPHGGDRSASDQGGRAWNTWRRSRRSVSTREHHDSVGLDVVAVQITSETDHSQGVLQDGPSPCPTITSPVPPPPAYIRDSLQVDSPGFLELENSSRFHTSTQGHRAQRTVTAVLSILILVALIGSIVAITLLVSKI
ncbi:hypothetical protein HETIRDRAFT_119335 [Heterobasidion irregulare TC 32-1]|uniref:Uncharacterized protein n=1 Tax=Heterobasidion irregulare (strain TC 32-1) TaxID=747525 RepID=W4JTB9_HETIT|nr:uncharacterized protein HETIRDRAFT_119335 [Heterobasidion irregulare TC 32-1]ETW76146.1 hypothetical protein HETIRDRAFT_119335 [Heterobasidion irregulare TC 32-1]